jgi:hypothetical protein
MAPILPHSSTVLRLAAVAACLFLALGAASTPAPNQIDAAIVRIGTGEMEQKPGILIVGAVDARKQYAKVLTDMVAAQLLAAANADPAQFDNVTYYIYSQPSPTAARRASATPLWESATNLTPTDDDRDGVVDEDGPEDLNGDGLITLMRVAESSGNYIPHPLDARVLIPVKPENGEAGRYSLYLEGTDNDGDELWNEDAVGGVDFNRNFPFDYPYFQPGSGAFACCESESKSLADWLWEHQNITAIITLGGDDNLHHLWPAWQTSGPVVTSPTAGDHLYFAKVAEKYKELAPRDGEPPPTEQRGSVLKWTYLHYGRWAFGVDPWWPMEPKKEVVVVEDGEEVAKEAAAEAKPEEEKETQDEASAEEPSEEKQPVETPADAESTEPEKPKWDEKDKRGEYELTALKWMDTAGTPAFVAWTPIAHPDFAGKTVEVGGFKPYVIVPSEAELTELAKQETAFVQAVAKMLPTVAFTDIETEDLGAGVTRLSVKVVNTGTLPTVSEMGEITRIPHRVQLTVSLPLRAAAGAWSGRG